MDDSVALLVARIDHVEDVIVVDLAATGRGDASALWLCRLRAVSGSALAFLDDLVDERNRVRIGFCVFEQVDEFFRAGVPQALMKLSHFLTVHAKKR